MPADFNGVVLGGYADQEGGFAYLSDEDRRRHLYAIGKSGVGKSTLIRAMIQSDVRLQTDARTNKPVAQLAIYALALARLSI